MGEQTKRGLNSAYICNGASNHSEVERELNDFYATPPIATFEKEPERGGAVAYAWYIWRKGNTNSPVIEWIK